MKFIRRFFSRGAFPDHLREAEPVHGESAPHGDVRSPYVLGRPRSRPPSIRLWRDIGTLPHGVRFAWGSNRCVRRVHRGVHVAPRFGYVCDDDIDEPAMDAAPHEVDPADVRPKCTPSMVANGITWDDVMKGRCR